MLIIQTNSSILSFDWFGDFILSHNKDVIFLPMSVIVFVNNSTKLMTKREEFLDKIVNYFFGETLYLQKMLKNVKKYKEKPIKIEFKQKHVVKSYVDIYLDAISHKEVRILFKNHNPWVYTFYVSQLDRFITELDNNRNIFLNASDDRSKNRLDRVLKKKTLLFFNIRFTYSKNFLTVLFTEYSDKHQNQYSQFHYNRDNSFNSLNYREDSELLKHYRVLDLQYGASLESVKVNFKKLAKMYHPDRVHHQNQTIIDLYTKKFQDIQASYQYLKEHLK
jgi:DnaJ-domain-containing protein 1